MSLNHGRNSLQNDSSLFRRNSYDHHRRSTSVDGRGRNSVGHSASKNRASSEERKSGNFHGWNGPRRSSLLNEPKGAMKDPRPLNDKAYQKRKISELVECLQESNFQFPVTPAKLMQPSKKDFENIFQHFINYYDEQYVVKRIEEEAPKILKNLCYPFIPNKSAFLYVARTNWPPLLGVLLFLMDITIYANKLDPKLVLRTTEGEQSKVLLEFIHSFYLCKNEDEEVAKDMLTQIAKKSLIPCDINELVKENSELKSNLEAVQSEIDSINSCKVLCDQQNESIEKYEDFFRKMKERHQTKMEVCQKLADELALKESELQKVNEVRARKQETYDAQGFDGRKQVSYYEKQIKELEEKLQEKKATRKDWQQKCWEVEMQQADAMDSFTLECESFNERYASVSQTSRKVLDFLGGMQDPQVKSLCSNLSIVFPDCKIKPSVRNFSQGANPRAKLEEIKEKIDSTNAILASLLTKQGQISSENEVKLSGLSIAMKVASVKETQKEKERSCNEKQIKEQWEELNSKYDETLKILGELQAERMEVEKKNKELSEELLAVENVKKDKQKMYEDYLLHQKDLINSFKKSVEETEMLVEEGGEEIYKALKKSVHGP